MATLVCEALEILTDSGLGVPVSYSNTAIGLATDGHFYLITDRPTITSVTGDTTRTVWYTGILTREFGNWTLSRNIDFVEAGAFEQVSDFTVGIKNTSDFRNTLQSNGVYLGRRRVKYYRVTSTDGAAWNFELRWTGIIDDQPFNEKTYSLRCLDVSKDIFGALPPAAVNSTTFEDAPKDSLDKMIPVAIGYAGYSQTANVSGDGDRTVLMMLGDYDYTLSMVVEGPYPSYVAGCQFYTPATDTPPEDGDNTQPILSITTAGMSFAENDSRLTGKYLKIISGGTSQSVRIVANAASSGSGYTSLYLAENLIAGGADPAFKGWFNPLTDTDVWYAEVVDYAATLLCSTRPISSFCKDESQQIQIHQFNSDSSKYESIGDVVSEYSETNIRSTGYPGLYVAANSGNDSGSQFVYQSIVPKAIHVYAVDSISGLPSVGATADTLRNQDPDDYYTLTTTSLTWSFTLDLTFASDSELRQFEDLYALFDFSHSLSGSALNVNMEVTAWSMDLLGRVTSTIFSHTLKNSPLGSSMTDVFRLPGSYYNTTRSEGAFLKEKGHYSIQSQVGDTKKLEAYNRVRIRIATSMGGGTYTMRLREFGLVGKRAISFSSQSAYTSMRGEVYGNTMDGRVSATDYPFSAVRALEYLIRNYDEDAPAWEAATAYVAGDMVRATADNGQIFVCTTAGTSHATTEPTWTDTEGATYTDGTVTWKQHHEIPIDTAQFDSAHGNRGLWLVGRTLTEKKKSLDYYRTLLEQSFLLGTMTPAGKVQVKAWLQNTTPVIAFSESNILQGTLGDVVLTPVRRMYNDLRVRYDKNPASGGFNKQITVTNIDRPQFPSADERVSTGVDLGSFSADYFIEDGDLQRIQFTTSSPHGLVSGNYVTLSGNADGYSFTARPVSVESTTVFSVYVSGYAFLASPTTSGTLTHDTAFRLKWKDYVTGILNYATAKDLWEQCHNSYLVTMAVNKLPDELGACEWFFDIYATDPNGKYLWSTDGGETPEYDLGDLHAAVGFVEGLANWTAWQKKQVTFETIDNATFSAVQLGDCVSFTDSKLTTGSTLTGWIHEKTQLPRDERRPERFRWGVTLYPEALNTYTPPGIIEEHGATDIYEENGATDIIEEHGA